MDSLHKFATTTSQKLSLSDEEFIGTAEPEGHSCDDLGGMVGCAAAPCTLSPARRPDHPRLEAALAGSVCPKCLEETALHCLHCMVCTECCHCVNAQPAAPCDRWFNTNNFHTRHHDAYRKTLFCPRGGDNSGAHNACRQLGDSRRTVGIYVDGTTFVHEDNWRAPTKAFKPKMIWRGTTTFKTKSASHDHKRIIR